ncbi:MAG TPA: class I SAM-dependent methyltransferase [bacterium]|nr:class I SAM-dependent methyltransferase [bacterium]
MAATFRLGLLKELHRDGSVTVADFGKRHEVDPGSLHALACAMRTADVVKYDAAAGTISQGAAFADVYASKGFFYWLIAGYGPMLQNLAALARTGHDRDRGPLRNGAEVARAAQDYGASFVDKTFLAVLQEEPLGTVADIGCGSAQRLIELARSHPDLRGVGVDIDPEVVDLAQARIETAGLESRLTALAGDLKTMQPTDECRNVDVIFSLFMGHDLWPRQDCIAALRGIREIFPNARRFLLCDTYQSGALTGDGIPVFTLGFELTHAVMRQYIPTVDEWMGVIEESGWTCTRRVELGIPYSCIFELRST